MRKIHAILLSRKAVNAIYFPPRRYRAVVLVRTKAGLRGARVDFEFAEGYISEISKRNLHQLAPAIIF